MPGEARQHLSTLDAPHPPVGERGACRGCGCQDTGRTIGGMSPGRGTKRTDFRIPPDLKAAAQARAAERGETLTDVVLRALREYVKEES